MGLYLDHNFFLYNIRWVERVGLGGMGVEQKVGQKIQVKIWEIFEIGF
jgi:hypothetical protein